MHKTRTSADVQIIRAEVFDIKTVHFFAAVNAWCPTLIIEK